MARPDPPNVIMVRTLRVVDAPEIAILVHIFQPVEIDEHWECRVEIDWPDGMRGFDVGGSDAVQACELALQFVGTQLYCHELHETGRLIWLEPGQGYGFPVPSTIRDLLIGEDRKQFG